MIYTRFTKDKNRSCIHLYLVISRWPNFVPTVCRLNSASMRVPQSPQEPRRSGKSIRLLGADTRYTRNQKPTSLGGRSTLEVANLLAFLKGRFEGCHIYFVKEGLNLLQVAVLRAIASATGNHRTEWTQAFRHCQPPPPPSPINAHFGFIHSRLATLITRHGGDIKLRLLVTYQERILSILRQKYFWRVPWNWMPHRQSSFKTDLHLLPLFFSVTVLAFFDDSTQTKSVSTHIFFSKCTYARLLLQSCW